MNLYANVARRLGGPIFIGAALLIISFFTAPARGGEPRESKRFLFVVDASTNMKLWEKPMRETLFDLIYSGLRGHMTNGDTFGVWVVGSGNDTSYPMETWKQKFAVEIAAKAVSHLKEHGFKGKPELDVAMADVMRVVKNVQDLTVIFVSNGETPLIGTPFDEAINARAKELAPVMKTAKATINASLVAQDGAFVAWAMNSKEYLLEIPDVAPKPKKSKPAPAVVKASAPAPTPEPAPAPVVARPSRMAVAPIIITKETVAEEKRSYTSTTTQAAVTVPAVTLVTNAIPALTELPATNSVVSAATNETNVVQSALPVIAPTNLAVAAPVVTAKEEPTNPPAAAVALVAPATVAKVSAEPSRFGTLLLYVGAGAGGAFLIVLVILLFNQSRHREPSLISQAIARERMQIH